MAFFFRYFFPLLLPVIIGSTLMATEVGDRRPTEIKLAQVETPAPYLSLLYGRHEAAFYAEQAAAWEALALGSCSTDEAWLNYYRAAVYANRLGRGSYDLAEILTTAQRMVSTDSFEDHFLRYRSSQDQVVRRKALLRAHAVAPERPEAYLELANVYQMTGQAEKLAQILTRLHELQPLPQGVLDYNYNQLQSVAENGILLTGGEVDSHPSWLLQTHYGIRPDVEVVNVIHLVYSSTYRERVFPDLKIALPSGGNHNDEEVTALMESLLADGRPVHLAATHLKMINRLPKERLYNQGLAFRYAVEPVENLAILAENFRRRFRLEQLRQPLGAGGAQRLADELNLNYLPALSELYEGIRSTDPELAEEVAATLRVVGKRAGLDENQLAIFLHEVATEQLASATPGVTAKQIDRAYRQLLQTYRETKYRKHRRHPEFTRLRMGATEVSNADYQLFLEDLLRQRKFAHLDTAAVQSADYVALLGAAADSIPPAELLALGLPTAPDHPVTNISNRAAQLYAEWLTQAYNNDPKRREGPAVRFRLPTRAEHEYAARGGREHAPYPWGGPYLRNSKGCFLANLNVLEYTPPANPDYEGVSSGEPVSASKEDCADGSWLTTPIDSYFPNDYGLYNMSGNAAEMTAVDGETVGGSWLDGPEPLQIGRMVKRSLPSPVVGFRLVMETVE